MCYTYNHTKSDLLAAILLLDSLVQDDVQEDIISTQNADDLAATIELHEKTLVEVLWQEVVMLAYARQDMKLEWERRSSAC